MKNSCVVLLHIWHSRAHKTENLQQWPALNIEKIQNNPQVCTQKKKPFSGKLVLQGKRTRKKLEKCSIIGTELQRVNIAWNQAGKPMNPQKIEICLLCGKKEKWHTKPMSSTCWRWLFFPKDPTRWLMSWTATWGRTATKLYYNRDCSPSTGTTEKADSQEKKTHTYTHTHTHQPLKDN